MTHTRPSVASCSRRASVLLLALIVIVLLTLGAMSFFERMFVEHQATQAHIRQTQARYLAESGVEFIRAMAIQDPNTLAAVGRHLRQSRAVPGQARDRRSAGRVSRAVHDPRPGAERVGLFRRHPLRPGKRIRAAESQHGAAGRQLRRRRRPQAADGAARHDRADRRRDPRLDRPRQRAAAARRGAGILFGAIAAVRAAQRAARLDRGAAAWSAT